MECEVDKGDLFAYENTIFLKKLPNMLLLIYQLFVSQIKNPCKHI